MQKMHHGNHQSALPDVVEATLRWLIMKTHPNGMTEARIEFVLTGDATANVWQGIVPSLPLSTRVFQVPHHGARNGTFDNAGGTPWLSHFQSQSEPVQVVMSSHISPHGHPHLDVVNALNAAAKTIMQYRTDLHYHVRFETDGEDVTVNYSHI
jgi:beta-lactamase superfamily II metal-dependent hydrolase